MKHPTPDIRSKTFYKRLEISTMMKWCDDMTMMILSDIEITLKV